MKEHKLQIIRILITAGLLLGWSIAPAEGWLQLCGYLAIYLLIAWDVLWEAVENILHGEIFDENFLMIVATVGAFCIEQYPEAVFVMLFFQIGELFEHIAVGKSRTSISDLVDLRPDYVNVERDGEIVRELPEHVHVGEIAVVKAGEKIPVDGVVLEGSSALDTKMLTGESMPREVSRGDAVFSGCINQSGYLRIRVAKELNESAAAKILQLVEASSEHKSKSETFIRKFAHWYTPAVVMGALLLAVVPSLIFGNWGEWLHRALIFLVISCPCALVISVPLTYFGGIGGASGKGILVKGSNYMDALTQVKTVVFDKTGTLTEGRFSVTEIHPAGMTEGDLLELAALAECRSNHPAAQSLREAYGKAIDENRVSEAEELPGMGICVKVDGEKVLAGNQRLMKRFEIQVPPADSSGSVVYLAKGERYAGFIVISDRIKEDSAAAVEQLRKLGVKKIVMLTGDRKAAGEAAAEELKLDEVHTELLPGDKVEQVERLLSRLKPGEKLAFVGDGMNDAPVLTRADVGVAMGALGADAAIEAADVVLMDDKPSRLAEGIRIAKRTKRIAGENIVFSLTVKAFFLILGACGAANLWEAVFADVGVMVIAVANAARALKNVDSAASHKKRGAA